MDIHIFLYIVPARVYNRVGNRKGDGGKGQAFTPVAGMHIVTKGLVLREVNYKESDKILTLLTEDEGKVTVKAQGCRRKNSPLAAASQLLVYSDMTLYEYQNRTSLNEASTLREFRGAREDITKLALGSYFAEICEAVAEEGVPTHGLLPLILNALHALDKLQKSEMLIKAAFELKLCCLIGYEPLLDGCAVCGKKEIERPQINLSDGVLHCKACRRELSAESISLPLNETLLSAMRYIVYGDPKRLFSFQIPQKELLELGGITESFLLTQLERGFRTLDFYKSLTVFSGGIQE